MGLSLWSFHSSRFNVSLVGIKKKRKEGRRYKKGKKGRKEEGIKKERRKERKKELKETTKKIT